MATVAYAQFPKNLSRNILRELDIRFWIISLVIFIFYNAFIFQMKNQVYVPSLEEKTKYLKTLYKIEREVLDEDIARRIADQEKLRQQKIKEREEKEKAEKVEEARSKRAALTEDQKAKMRADAKRDRTQRSAEMRRKAAQQFQAAGMARRAGIGGIGKGGKGEGSGRDLSGIVGSERGIVSGGSATLGELSTVVAGGTYEGVAGDIKITDIDASEMEAGELAGSLEMEEVEEVVGEAAEHVFRSSEVLNETIQSKKPSITTCFEKYKRKDPQLSGRLIIKFYILADGSVNRITIRSDWSNPRMGSKVEDSIRKKIDRWRFASIEKGDVQIEFQMSFY